MVTLLENEETEQLLDFAVDDSMLSQNDSTQPDLFSLGDTGILQGEQVDNLDLGDWNW